MADFKPPSAPTGNLGLPIGPPAKQHFQVQPQTYLMKDYITCFCRPQKCTIYKKGYKSVVVNLKKKSNIKKSVIYNTILQGISLELCPSNRLFTLLWRAIHKWSIKNIKIKFCLLYGTSPDAKIRDKVKRRGSNRDVQL